MKRLREEISNNDGCERSSGTRSRSNSNNRGGEGEHLQSEQIPSLSQRAGLLLTVDNQDPQENVLLQRTPLDEDSLSDGPFAISEELAIGCMVDKAFVEHTSSPQNAPTIPAT